jgi:hypothetical protein
MQVLYAMFWGEAQTQKEQKSHQKMAIDAYEY